VSITFRQSAGNAVAKAGPGDKGSTTVRATFDKATVAGSLVLVVATTAGGVEMPHSLSVSGYTRLDSIAVRDLQLTVWMRENAPSVSSISVSVQAYRSMQLRLFEYPGIAQAGALDRLTRQSGESRSPSTGRSGTTAQADELVFAVIANQYASTTQSGFTGGLAKLYESVSPRSDDHDWERSRHSIHHGATTSTGSFSLSASLSTTRRWIGLLATFKGGSTGPLQISSTDQPPVLDWGGGGELTLFGPLSSTDTDPVWDAGEVVRARIGPSTYQYRLGGWDGLLIGAGTPYRVESIEGLEGWQVRTSDDDLPRGDGALRGVDLQAARQILFKVNVASTDRAEVEHAMDVLYRALVPQRDEDWELLFRHPGRPLRSVWCRPVDLARELSLRQTIVNHQGFALRAADPRHYSAQIHMVDVPVTPAGADPIIVTANNIGNGPAYPIIRINGPDWGDPATRVVLTNLTTDVRLNLRSVLPRGSTLVADMPAHATGAPRSPITIDGQPKYGAWQPPRRTFAIWPGINELMFEVEPAGAPVPPCSLEYHSSWSG
jgi:hypothetical protein